LARVSVTSLAILLVTCSSFILPEILILDYQKATLPGWLFCFLRDYQV
jgi:hypothetical protein